MTKSVFMRAGVLGAFVTTLLASSMPVQAQDDDHRGWRNRGEQTEPPERPERPQRADRPQRSVRGMWIGSELRGAREAQAQAQIQAPAGPAPQMQRRGNYGADGRDRSYGAYNRSGDWGVERQAREVAARARPGGGPEWRDERRQERGEDARETGRDHRQGNRAAQTADRRDDHGDVRHAYRHGYRAGDRSDDRRWEGNSRWDHRQFGHRWDNRGWRHDSRYDWHRYRAANRHIYRVGPYYSPYNNFRYNRIGIGFRLGSPFYSNRYWINDPWRYRLPNAYGPYRWVRYYDDALLIDTYSGQVVDVIHDFFW